MFDSGVDCVSVVHVVGSDTPRLGQESGSSGSGSNTRTPEVTFTMRVRMRLHTCVQHRQIKIIIHDIVHTINFKVTTVYRDIYEQNMS